ncbi:MAG: hypothetical protein CMK07_12905 [Ponticaulis sp.]|nr:hypothetical protein [Ponticaulis sp.]
MKPAPFRMLVKSIALSGLLITTGCSKPISSELQQAYTTYATEIMQGHGHKAAKRVSQDTIEHYLSLRDTALEGGTPQGLYDEVSVYYLRAKFDDVSIAKLTGRDVMNVLAKAELIGEKDFNEYTLSDIRYTEVEARADLVKGGETTPFEIRFTKEDGEWRVHPERFRAKRNELLEKRIVTFEGQRDDVISELLKMRGIDSGLTPALRQPLRQPSG